MSLSDVALPINGVAEHPQPVNNGLCSTFNVFRVLKAGDLYLLDCFHPSGNRLPVGLRNIPVRPEIEHGLLSDFRVLALILDQSIGVVGFSIKPIGNLGAPGKHG